MKVKAITITKLAAREAASLVVRLGEKVKDKFIWTKEEIESAHTYLHHFKNQLRNEEHSLYTEIFGETEKFFHIRPFKKGYNMKSVTFKTKKDGQIKRWVLKIGHRISPVIDYGDPGTHTFFLEHKRHLQILRNHTKDNPHLQYLIPEPQVVIWDSTTLALQPFVHVMKNGKIQKKVSSQKKKRLLREFKEFKKLCNILISEHHVRPDLLGEGNLIVAKFGNEYHLVLLDTGLVNTDAPLPITQTVMEFASQQTLSKLEGLLK